jgi:hypothetical protein
MKRIGWLGLMVLLVLVPVVAAQNWESLSPFHNARFVYVTSYSGPQVSPNPLPSDQAAIGAVQSAFQRWGYTVVYSPQEADMIAVVQGRESEDVLAIYDPASWRHGGTYLWRQTAKGGLSGPDYPLIEQLGTALRRVQGQTPA